MEPDSEKLLVKLLDSIEVRYVKLMHKGRCRFKLLLGIGTEYEGLYVNIPCIQKFTLQLMFEGKYLNKNLRQEIADELRKRTNKPYPHGGGIGSHYLTIYLPDKNMLKICVETYEEIGRIIKTETKNIIDLKRMYAKE